MIERVRRPARSHIRLRRKRHDEDRHVVDAPADNKRLRDSDGNPVEIGANLVVHAQDCFVGFGADKEAGGHDDPVVVGRAIDMLDAVDRLDDGLKRLGHEPGGVLRLEAVRAHLDIHHRHGDLGLFLAR